MARRARALPAREPDGVPPRLSDLLLRPDVVSPLVVGLFLLIAPLFFIPTGGISPLAGAILVGLTLGRVTKRLRRRRGDMLIGLGAGLALGAVFTQWSTATNFLFVLAGAVVAVQGFALTRRQTVRER
jgi:hypothetical protein